MQRNAKVKKVHQVMIVTVKVEGKDEFEELIRADNDGTTINVEVEDLQEILELVMRSIFPRGTIAKVALEGPPRTPKSKDPPASSILTRSRKPLVPKKPGKPGKGSNGAN